MLIYRCNGLRNSGREIRREREKERQRERERERQTEIDRESIFI